MMRPTVWIMLAISLICLHSAHGFTEQMCEAVSNSMRAWCSTSRDEWLSIDRAFWGREGNTTCPHTQIQQSSCQSDTFLEAAREVCDGRKDCKITPNWRVLGDPCPGTYKYANITYTCKACTNTLSDTECESRAASGQCKDSATVLNMRRDCFKTCSRCDMFNESTCENVHGQEQFATMNVDCDYWAFGGECTNNPEWMNENCKESCRACASEASVTKTACEGQYIDLQCDTNYFLNIRAVGYGRYSQGFCPTETEVNTTGCYESSLARPRVQEACHGRPSCSVLTTNAAMDPNDPCPGAPKQAEITYSCQVCVNSLGDAECEELATAYECIYNSEFMMENCFKTCSDCSKGGCSNVADERDCTFWAMNNQCDSNPGFMHYQCSKSCKTCDCKNDANDNDCVWWASTGECESNPGWMPYKCARACLTCHECNNVYSDDDACRAWANGGECQTNPNWMLRKCAHACYACGDKVGEFSTGSCEGEARQLECPNPTHRLRVTEVFYGRRNNDTCAHVTYNPNNVCEAAQSKLETVIEYCNGRSSCYITPIAAVFDDPCPGVTKQLEAKYYCQVCTNRAGDMVCEARRGAGECDLAREVMLDDCFAACTGCKVQECVNTDSAQNCDYWGMTDECANNPDYMNQRCARACDSC